MGKGLIPYGEAPHVLGDGVGLGAEEAGLKRGPYGRRPGTPGWRRGMKTGGSQTPPLRRIGCGRWGKVGCRWLCVGAGGSSHPHPSLLPQGRRRKRDARCAEDGRVRDAAPTKDGDASGRGG